MILLLSPSASAFGTPSYLHRPHYRPTSASPRDRYLAAVSEARSAEANYLASLEAEREERLQRELARRQLLFGSSDTDFIHPRYARPPSYSRQNDLEERVARLEREREYWRSACLRHSESQDEYGQGCGSRILCRQPELGLKRKMQARQQREALQRAEQHSDTRLPQQAELEEAFKLFLTTLSAKQTEMAQSRPGQNRCERRFNHRGMRECLRDQNSQAKPSCQPKTSSASSGASGQSLKQSLETRLGNEPENEIRDTIQAIIASIFHPQPSTAERPASQSKPETGKGKAVAFDGVESAHGNVSKSLDAIRSIEAAFRLVESEFSMPRTLDFTPPPSPTATSQPELDNPRLSYTSGNAPIHNYMHTLSQLLTQLDAVDSFGDEAVRAKRKLVVELVEQALEVVENEVEQKGRLSRRVSKEIVVNADEGKPQDDVVELQEKELKPTAESAPSEAVVTDPIVPYDVTIPDVSEVLEEQSRADVAPAQDGPLSHDEPTKIEVHAVTAAINEPHSQVSTNIADAPIVSDVSNDNSHSDPAESKATVTNDDDASSFSSESSSHEPVVDTFLLPVSHSPVTDGSPVIEEDLVVVEEGGDGDTWSDIGA